MIPLYGFLQGDTMGLLLLAQETDSMVQLAARLESAASVRVAPRGGLRVLYEGNLIERNKTVTQARMRPLGRIDVVQVQSDDFSRSDDTR